MEKRKGNPSPQKDMSKWNESKKRGTTGDQRNSRRLKGGGEFQASLPIAALKNQKKRYRKAHHKGGGKGGGV